MNNIITHRHETDGKIGIGKIPNYLYYTLNNISTEYIYHVRDKSSTAYHTYYTHLYGNLKDNFDKIQYNPFWNSICDNTSNCIKYDVTEMNEIYYSNPTPNFTNQNLYGAAANLVPHKDCILFRFSGIHFYRIIIGLTDYNEDVFTKLINFNLEHNINKGDYVLFDFDKTLHQVNKLGHNETPRILLKLHFIVCENCKYSNNYVKFITNFYKYYYYIARYTEQIGTDPKTFSGFFWGLIWEWPFYSSFKYVVGLLFITNLLILHRKYKIKFNYNNFGKLTVYTVSNMFFTYTLIVFFYYLRYVLFNIK